MNLLQALYPLKVLMSKDSFLYKKIRTMYRKYMMNNNYLALLNHDFRAGTGYNLNLESPQTFNEKLQWLKCYYRDPLMARCADKVTARTFVKERIGGEHLIPIYGIYNKVEEIPTYFIKSPLQRVIQLLKRQRDIYFSAIKKEDKK